MPGCSCWFAVVYAAVQLALSGVGCLWCLPGRGCCCAGARPPSWRGGFLFPPSARAGALPPALPPAVARGGMRCPSCSVVLRLGVGCFVRRAVFCCAVPCCCAGALLGGVLVCCAVGRPPLALATPFLSVSQGAPRRRAVLCGVSLCVVPSCVVVCCGVFLVAVWCRGCSLSAFSVLHMAGGWCANHCTGDCEQDDNEHEDNTQLHIVLVLKPA